MDPRINPYSPGAGTPPLELAGRDDIIEQINIQLDRCKNGLSFRSYLLVGLRGVGKTVLLNSLSIGAEYKKMATIFVETPEKRSLPALLIPALRSSLVKMNSLSVAGEMGKKALRVLGGFVSAMKLKYQDIEFGVDLGVEPGVADSGDLEADLTDLFLQLGNAAQEKKTAFVLFMDEVQYIQENEFAALIMALHKCSQKKLPVALVGAGLPQLIGRAGRAKSYAERLFLYPEIGALDHHAAQKALEIPAQNLGVSYCQEAINEILKQTQGYPYFLQEWGKHCWQTVEVSPITQDDVIKATSIAIAELDASFFRVRFDRLTPVEKRYLRAMAELGEGPHRSGDIATLLKKEVQAVAPTRASLVKKGMIYSTQHGENSFTVPLFADYMKRVMPKIFQ